MPEASFRDGPSLRKILLFALYVTIFAFVFTAIWRASHPQPIPVAPSGPANLESSQAAADIASNQSSSFEFELLKARETFHAFYNDRDLSDLDRAQLIRFVSVTTSFEMWRAAEVAPGETVDAFFGKVYNLSLETAPLSVNTLVQIVNASNDFMLDLPHSDTLLPPQASLNNRNHGIQVRVPPLPPHVSTTKSEGELFTIRVQELGSDLLRSVEDLGELARVPPSKLAVAEHPQSGNATVLMLGTYNEISAQIHLHGYVPPPLPVQIMRNDGNVDLILSQGVQVNASKQCRGPDEWLNKSPASQALNQRIATISKDVQLQADIAHKAAQENLVLIDWVQSPLLHGEKVRSVARFVLDKLLHLPQLTQFVKLVDLNPANSGNQNDLLSLLHEYEDVYCVENPGICSDAKSTRYAHGLFRDAEDWIKSGGHTDERFKPSGVDRRAGGASPTSGRFPVRQLLLEAAVWHYLRPSSHSWVNMSFSVPELGSGVTSPSKLSTSNSFVFSAADDKHVQEGITFPQQLASDHPQFVNVTYGDPSGGVDGGYTSGPPVPIVVSLLAPGCGYSYESIAPSDLGSSYATPFVAAFSWAKHLVDDVSVGNMRAALLEASLMLPVEIPIESSGVFDPAILLTQNASWYAEYPQKLMTIQNGSIIVTYKDGAGRKNALTCDAGLRCSLLFFSDKEGPRVRIRKLPINPLNSSLQTFSVDSFECTIKDADNTLVSLCRDKSSLGAAATAPRLVSIVFKGDGHIISRTN